MAIYNLYDPEGKSLIKEFEAKYGRVSASLHYSASNNGGNGCRSSAWVNKRYSQSLQDQIWCCTECSSSEATPNCGKPDTHEFFGHVRQIDDNCTCKCDEYLHRAELRWSGSDPSGSQVDPLWINI